MMKWLLRKLSELARSKLAIPPDEPQRVEVNLFDLIEKGNLALADILLRAELEKTPNNPMTLNYLGEIAVMVNLHQAAQCYFKEAVKLDSSFEVAQTNLNSVNRYLNVHQQQHIIDKSINNKSIEKDKFILIKAWGFGFFADVNHVLGQLLIAELTDRIPIVHWGTNSLFGDGTTANAFDFYFKPVSDRKITDLQYQQIDFWPPKWSSQNIIEDNINKWKGSFSKVAGLYLLGRQEKVIVSDFFTPVFDLKPWIPEKHHLYGLSVDDLYLYLVNKYLHPQQEILDKVDHFYQKYIGTPDFMAVHVRGSDKVVEYHDLAETNKQYKDIIDKYLSIHDFQRIFFMTDDFRILDDFKIIYGDKLISTECHRTNNSTGIHYQEGADKRQIGREVVLDAYLAARAKVFIGNGTSNPSQIVRYLKKWPEGAVTLLSDNTYQKSNAFIHL